MIEDVHHARYYENLIDKEDLKKRLPKVGMTILKKSSYIPGRHEGKVTCVNTGKLWYEVQFKHNDFVWKECFKVPEKTPAYS